MFKTLFLDLILSRRKIAAAEGITRIETIKLISTADIIASEISRNN